MRLFAGHREPGQVDGALGIDVKCVVVVRSEYGIAGHRRGLRPVRAGIGGLCEAQRVHRPFVTGKRFRHEIRGVQRTVRRVRDLGWNLAVDGETTERVAKHEGRGIRDVRTNVEPSIAPAVRRGYPCEREPSVGRSRDDWRRAPRAGGESHRRSESRRCGGAIIGSRNRSAIARASGDCRRSDREGCEPRTTIRSHHRLPEMSARRPANTCRGVPRASYP